MLACICFFLKSCHVLPCHNIIISLLWPCWSENRKENKDIINLQCLLPGKCTKTLLNASSHLYLSFALSLAFIAAWNWFFSVHLRIFSNLFIFISFRLVHWASSQIDPIGVDYILQKLGFSHARVTIPKWMQRGFMDPMDKVLSVLVNKLMLVLREKPTTGDEDTWGCWKTVLLITSSNNKHFLQNKTKEAA